MPLLLWAGLALSPVMFGGYEELDEVFRRYPQVVYVMLGFVGMANVITLAVAMVAVRRECRGDVRCTVRLLLWFCLFNALAAAAYAWRGWTPVRRRERAPG